MTALAFALVVWWTSNTIAHLFIHRPFFRRRSANRLFALGMSLALGIPQTLWRDRHLAHVMLAPFQSADRNNATLGLE